MNKQVILMYLVVMLMLIQASHTRESIRLLNSNSSPTTIKFCSRFNNRDLVGDKDGSERADNKNAMAAYWKISGNDFFSSVFQSNDIISTGISHTRGMIIPIIFFIGPFLIGFLVLILIWPFLLCCCLCPRCCPSRCLRKPDFEPYTKCELIWPSVFLITALLLVVLASMIGIIKASDIENSFYAVGCSVSLTFDDVMNGNISSDGAKFIGVKSFVEGMKILNVQLGNLERDMNNLVVSGGALDLVFSEGETMLSNIAKIPNGTADQYLPDFSYNRFSDGNSTNPINSILPSIIGKASISGPNEGAVGNMYNTMSNVNEGIIKKIKTSTEIFINSVNSVSSPLGSILNSIINQMSSMQAAVESTDEQIEFMSDKVSPILKIITTLITVIFGVFAGLGLLGVAGTVIMTFCRKLKCRYLLNFVCLTFVFLGIICFLITIIFSIVTPMLYLACDFLETTISNESNFEENLGIFLRDETANNIKVCLPGGSGKFLDNMALDLTGLMNIDDAIYDMKRFNDTKIQKEIENSFIEISNEIKKYYFTNTVDFINQINLNFMKKIANPMPNYAGCTFGNDQWIPGLGQTEIICATATLSTGNASIAECPSNTEIGSTSDPACQGCLDTTKIIYNVNGVSDLKNRYGSCTSWSNDIQAVWDNYYLIKKNNVEPAIIKLDTIVNSLSTGYNSKLANLKTDFDTVIFNIQANLDTVFNENTGILTGLNCLILGEDINLIVSTTCDSLFNTFFFLRIILGIVSFSILFIICCITFSGVRAYKHSEKLKEIIPDDEEGKIDMVVHEETAFSLGQKE